MTSLFFSDILGYSQMVAKDESHTLNLLSEHDIILKKHIINNNGTIIKHIGDAIFAKFNTPQSAIDASLLIQNELNKRNETLPDNDKIVIRIGLHQGDVVEKDNDLFGNEVNLCSRIESIAVPGGIACSDFFYKDIENVFSRSYGFVKLKNIPKPFKVHRVYNNEIEYSIDNPDSLRSLLDSRNVNIVQSDDIVLDYKTIAFLYPENLGDKNQEFFCFEFLQQLINDSNKIELIRSPSITDIIKMNDQKNNLTEISRKLAVENIAELSLLCLDEKFKVNIAVKSMNTGLIIYEESFDSDISDIRSVTGKIMVEIATIFNLDVSDHLKKIFKQKVDVDNKAYKLFLEGKSLSTKVKDSESLDNSKLKLKEAISIDDEFIQAYAALGLTYSLLGDYEEAEEHLETALDLSEDIDNIEILSFVFGYLGIFYKKLKKIKKSIKYFEKAIKSQKKIGSKIELSTLYHNMAACYGVDGNAEQMLILIERSQKNYLELDETVLLGNSYGEMGNALKTLGKHEEAITMFNKAKPIFLSEEMYFKYTQVLIIQADTYIDQSNYSQAQNNLVEAQKYAEKFNVPIMNARILFALAKVMYAKEKLSDAVNYIDDSIDIFQDLNNKGQLSSLFILKANIMMDRKKIKTASKCLEKAEKYMKKNNDSVLISNLNIAKERYNSLV